MAILAGSIRLGEASVPQSGQCSSAVDEGLALGKFYNEHRSKNLNAATLEVRIRELIDDEEVGNQRGIYEYLLTGNEKTLNLRTFDDKTKVRIYTQQRGICPVCKEHFEFGDMEADHIIPWSQKGKTTPDNCQMLCKMDNRTKSGK